MNDPDTFWLTVTNIALGALVVSLAAGVATGVVCDFVLKLRARHRAERGLDREMHDLFHPRR